MSLVFGEALLLCGVAAGIGLAIASVIAPVIYREIGAGGLELPWSVVGMGLAISVAVAVVSALPPAWRAQRLNIVDALAGR
jgi:putative ABC transport system permease protein